MKKNILSLVLIVIMLFAVLSSAGCSDDGPAPVPTKPSHNSIDDGDPDDNVDTDDEFRIIAAKTSNIRYEKYDNGLVSLDIPEGWKVDVPSVGYAGYTIKVYDPEDSDYVFVFSLKLTGFLKTEAARAAFESLYPTSVYGRLAAIDPQTTEAFYKVWNHNAKLANEEQFKYKYYPYLNDFTLVENLGKLPFGGDVLRASFNSDNGNPMQGLFTASIYNPGEYIMYGYDFAPLSSYHNIMMMAPEAEFNNWMGIMDHCIGTIQFSEAFMTGFYREEEILVSTVQANQKIYDGISDMIMDSWEKRNNSYDIISQKRSDATLGYERVYDTETGDVYRAYNGFTDDYSGNRYASVTDDMYTSVISGYIEK